MLMSHMIVTDSLMSLMIHCPPTQMAAATVARKAEPIPPLEKVD